ncbi:ArsR/SmtB family transcription factor [Pacificispira sp.]|uniref:ArsR/SmtB family transcription factor n=1 Tax=Pacificispira sp. TaxID=2888761 RepID=UPI003BACFF97
MSELEQTAACLEALGNPTRLAMYRLLVRAGEEGKSVGQIQAALSIPASTLSHHLKHLELVGLVQKRREGTTHTCVANYMTMNAVLGYLTEECCADSHVAPSQPHQAHKISA